MDILNSMPNAKKKYLTSFAHSSIAQRQAKVSSAQSFISLERLMFYHASLGGTPLKILKQAINAGYLKSWAGLTLLSIRKLTEPDLTHLGHLVHSRKNIQSTKEDELKLILNEPITDKTNDFYHKLIDFIDSIRADQTGHFSRRSLVGNHYVLVTYSRDISAILVRPLKN